MRGYDTELVQEMYQLASSLLWSQNAAEAVVLETCACVPDTSNREVIFGELISRLGRKRRWSMTGRTADPTLRFLRNEKSPYVELLVLADVCGFGSGAISRMLKRSELECEQGLEEARMRFYRVLHSERPFTSATRNVQSSSSATPAA